MSDVPLNELLHTTVLDLHALHDFIESQDKEYANLLRKTTAGILILLGYYGKSCHRIDLHAFSSNDDIGDINVLYYRNKENKNRWTALSGEKDISLVDQILPLVRTKCDDSKLILRKLIEILSSTDSDKKPRRIKGTYLTILLRFSELLAHFIEMRLEAEKIITDYLGICFLHEFTLFSVAQQELDSRLIVSDDATEKVLSIVDRLVSRPTARIDEEDISMLSKASENESIFSYESTTRDRESLKDRSFQFECSDTQFSSLYRSFLQIIFIKFQSVDTSKVHDCILPYVLLMLNLYKRQREIGFLELDEFKFREKKIGIFYEFFLGGPYFNSDEILPKCFQKISEHVLSEAEVLPEIEGIDFDYNHVEDNNLSSQDRLFHSSSAGSRRIQGASIPSSIGLIKNLSNRTVKEISFKDLLLLVHDIRIIIPLLNEFDLNFNEEFPGVLTRYLYSIYEEFTEFSSSKDREYIHTLYELVENISKFEQEDSSISEEDIKETVVNFYQIHALLDENSSKVFPASTTILMRYAILSYKVNKSLLLKCFKDWNFKTLSVSQLYHSLNTSWLPELNMKLMQKFLDRWYNQKNKIEKLKDVTSKFYGLTLLRKIMIEKWYHKLSHYRVLLENIDSEFERQFFKKWNYSWNSRLMDYSKASSIYSSKLKRTYLSVFVQNFSYYNELESSALLAKSQFLKRHNHTLLLLFFRTWCFRFNISFSSTSTDQYSIELLESSSSCRNNENCLLNSKLIHLIDSERSFILRKYFRTFTEMYSERLVLKRFQSWKRELQLRFFFQNQWLKKLSLNEKSSEVITKKDFQLKGKYFLYWNDQVRSFEVARDFYRKTLLHRYYALWQLETSFKQAKDHIHYIKISRSGILAKYFKIWKLSHRALCLKGQRNHECVMVIFNLFRDRFLQVRLNLEKSRNLESTHFKRRIAEIWYSSFKQLDEMSSKADMFLERKFFNLIRSKLEEYNQHLSLASNGGASMKFKKAGRYLLIDYITLVSCFVLWRRRLENSFEAKYGSQLRKYIIGTVSPRLTYKLFSNWVRRFNEKQYHSLELERRLFLYPTSNSLKELLFRRWVDATNRSFEQVSLSQNFESRILQKKFLGIWYNQFVQLEELKGICDDFLGQREFNKIREAISIWSMKFIKLIRRNQQSCDIFMKRWQIAKLKSVFELWHYKLKERRSMYLYKEELLGFNDSANVNNSSPLANKSFYRSMRLNEDQNMGADRGYLYTPLKPRTSIVPSTPSIHAQTLKESPSKLQETTQRIKQEQIEALRNHFKKAKGSSTPTKEDNSRREVASSTLFDKDNSKFIRLSPPKKNTYNVILPPDPPNFHSPKREDSPHFISEEPDVSLISTTIADERSLIETAKQLRRITPIFIPTEDTLEPQISSARRLRQKLEEELFDLSSLRKERTNA